MSIQSFAETLIAAIEKSFESDANNLLKAVRQRTGNEQQIAGHMDGLSDCVKKIHEVHKLFVNPDAEPEENNVKSLY